MYEFPIIRKYYLLMFITQQKKNYESTKIKKKMSVYF